MSILVAAILAACGADPNAGPITPPCHGKCDAPGGVTDGDHDGSSVCLAIRGNGPRITAHFGAIARLLEHHGLIDGVAGGSSGSISAFLLDSVQLNPAVYRCGGGACTARQTGERAAFLFKSLRGYIEVLSQTDESLAFAEVARLAEQVQAHDLETLLSSDPAAGRAALETILTSPELRPLINPEMLELVRTSPDPLFHARDLAATLKKGLAFEATDPTVLVRPGAVDFRVFVERLGRIGSFYAGYGPTDGDALGPLLDTCAPAAVDRVLADAAATPYDGATCGERFHGLLTAWRAEVIGHPASYPSRLDDEVGATLPALVTTGVLEGDGATAWRAARASYQAAHPITSLGIDFADVGVGYFGYPGDLDLIEAGAARRTDLKSHKRRALGAATWRLALATSPAEPGLSRGVELSDGRISVGGWSDLQPTTVLEDLGCDQIVFLTRFGGAGTFETGISNLLGIDAAASVALYALDDPRSSYHAALVAADGVWCSDWDRPAVSDLDAMTAIGYDAAFETSSTFFTRASRPVPSLTPRTGIAGCTLGVTP